MEEERWGMSWRTKRPERQCPMEGEKQRSMEERRAERRQMEAGRCIEEERQRMEAERRRVEAELRRMQPERRRREREIPTRRRRERVSMSLSRRTEREATEEEVEAEWESRMEKAEVQSERRKSRRKMPRRRRVQMDEAKWAELELERKRNMDAQRMKVEVARMETFLAEFERQEEEMKAKRDARNKRVDENIHTCQVWWKAWSDAKDQGREEEWEDRGEEGEDRKWVKTWALRGVVADWKVWESDNSDDFIELYDSVCLDKMNELGSNSWRKKVEFGKELEDVELMKYCRKYIDFRNCWENKYSYPHGLFEGITPKRRMFYTCGPVPRLVFEGPRPRTLQVFSVKIGGSIWPLQVYGFIAVWDFIDPQCNMIFNRGRHECQIITEEDPYLPLTGPTRAIVVNMNESIGPVTIESVLKVRGAVESEDRYIILDVISLPTLIGSKPLELAGPHMKLEVSLGLIHRSVEATIFIRLIDGTWPIGFHGQFVAKTASIEYNKVILLEFSGDGEMNQSRSVMSVEASGILIVTLKAWRGEEVGSVIFNAVNRGRSFQTINLSSCSVQVLVAWSLISPYCEELVPPGLMELCNF